MQPLYRNRSDAGQALGATLLHRCRDWPGIIVLGLPRGGVPVAAEIARLLGAPLDVLPVRKLGVPGDSEFAMGAIAAGGVCIMDQQVTDALRISEAAVERVRLAEEAELRRRERAYRQGRPPLDLDGKTAILVDDGLATGATMRAAVAAARKLGAARVVAAVPVGSAQAHAILAQEADDVVCLHCPVRFQAVGQWYGTFAQVPDADVETILSRAASGESGGA